MVGLASKAVCLGPLLQHSQPWQIRISAALPELSFHSRALFKSAVYMAHPRICRWQHGGTDVYITGTFTNWREHKRMHRSGNDFTYMSMLPRGKHQFKFIVDGHWRWATDIRTETDEESVRLDWLTKCLPLTSAASVYTNS